MVKNMSLHRLLISVTILHLSSQMLLLKAACVTYLGHHQPGA